MLDRDISVDDLKHLHAQFCICRNCLRVNLSDVKLRGIHKCEEASAEGNRKFYLFPVDSHFLILFVNESRYIGQGHALYLSFLYNSGRTN